MTTNCFYSIYVERYFLFYSWKISPQQRNNEGGKVREENFLKYLAFYSIGFNVDFYVGGKNSFPEHCCPLSLAQLHLNFHFICRKKENIKRRRKHKKKPLQKTGVHIPLEESNLAVTSSKGSPIKVALHVPLAS